MKKLLLILPLLFWVGCEEEKDELNDILVITNEQKVFADNHWSIINWVENTLLNPVTGLIQYEDFKLDGTHKLELHLSGSLAEAFGEFVSSDSLVTHPEWIYSDEMSVVRDDSFYFHIGEENQFVGGWDDAFEWYTVEKTVEGAIVIIFMTPNKKTFLDMGL